MAVTIPVRRTGGKLIIVPAQPVEKKKGLINKKEKMKPLPGWRNGQTRRSQKPMGETP